MINISEEIRLRFYKELVTGKRVYFKIPFEPCIDYLPSKLADIVEMDEKGLFIYPHKPVFDIIRTIRFVKENGKELLPLLSEAYKNQSNKMNYGSIN